MINFLSKNILKKIHSVRLSKKTIILIVVVVAIVGIVLRLAVSVLGNNHDFESYLITYTATHNFINDLQSPSIYTLTERYNYGPVWFLWLYTLGSAVQILPPESQIRIWRYLIIATLSAADIIIAVTIFKRYGFWKSLLYFLSPLSIIISGYHNQFDTIPIAIMFVSTIWYEKSNKNFKYSLLYSLLIGISISIKHIFIFWPFWILFKQKITIKCLLLFALPYFIFLTSFFPFIRNGNDVYSIVQHVFLYTSYNNAPFYQFVLSGFIMELAQPVHIFFILLVFVLPIIVKRVSFLNSFLVYLVSIFIFSPSIANQYLIIPLISLVASTNIFTVVYIIATSCFLLVDYDALKLWGYVGGYERPYYIFSLTVFMWLLKRLGLFDKLRTYSVSNLQSFVQKQLGGDK